MRPISQSGDDNSSLDLYSDNFFFIWRDNQIRKIYLSTDDCISIKGLCKCDTE